MSGSTCRLLFFSLLKDVVGRSEMAWELTSPVPVGEIYSQLCTQFPALVSYRPSLLMAVNQTYVPAETLVQPGDEVAYMPPVQGG